MVYFEPKHSLYDGSALSPCKHTHVGTLNYGSVSPRCWHKIQISTEYCLCIKSFGIVLSISLNDQTCRNTHLVKPLTRYDCISLDTNITQKDTTSLSSLAKIKITIERCLLWDVFLYFLKNDALQSADPLTCLAINCRTSSSVSKLSGERTT
jgi:hypothetical protein